MDGDSVRCEGCTRRVTVEELRVVTVPGRTMACCETCEAHVQAVTDAHSETVECEGCTRTLSLDEAVRLTLPDGAEVTCCLACRRSWEGDAEGEPCSQCSEPADDLADVTTIDGRTERFCQECLARAEEQGIVGSVAMATAEAREILGVGPDADQETIRAAFHRQVRRAHPDMPTGSKSAFSLVTEAYDRLSSD